LLNDGIVGLASKAGYQIDNDTANKIGEGLQEGLRRFGGGEFQF